MERTLALNPDLHTLSGLPKYEAGNLLYIGNQIKVDSLKCCSKVLFSHFSSNTIRRYSSAYSTDPAPVRPEAS